MNIFKSKVQKEKENFMDNIIADIPFMYKKQAEYYGSQIKNQNSKDLIFLRNYYNSYVAPTLVMMDYLIEVGHGEIFNLIKKCTQNQMISLAKAMGACLMVMFLKSEGNVNYLNKIELDINQFIASLTMSYKFDEKENEFLKKLFKAWNRETEKYNQFCFAWTTHFYEYVLGINENLDISQRLLIDGAIAMGYEIFLEELKKQMA